MAASQLVSRASTSSQFPRELTPPALSLSRSLRFPSFARTKSLASRLPRTGAASTSAPATVRFLHCFSKDEDGFLCCEGGRVQDVIETVERICLRRAWMEALPAGLRSVIGYARKADNNFKILEHLRGFGSGELCSSLGTLEKPDLILDTRYFFFDSKIFS